MLIAVVVNVSQPLQELRRSFTLIIAKKLGFGAAHLRLFCL